MTEAVEKTEQTEEKAPQKRYGRSEPRAQPRPLKFPGPAGNRGLNAADFKLADMSRNLWEARPVYGATLEDVLKPTYWAHVAKIVKPGDKIEVFCQDGSWEAELRVMRIEATEVYVSVIQSVQHEAQEEVEEDSPYFIKWSGPHHKFCVVRRDNNEVMAKCLYPREAAHSWIARHRPGKARK